MDARDTWLEDGRAVSLPSEISEEFDDYLNQLPWGGSSLFWSRIPSHVCIDVSVCTAGEFEAWLDQTLVGQHASLAVWYSRAEGGIVVPLIRSRELLDHLDELYMGHPGIRFCFGVDNAGSGAYYDYAAILQYNYAGDDMFAVAR